MMQEILRCWQAGHLGSGKEEEVQVMMHNREHTLDEISAHTSDSALLCMARSLEKGLG